MNSLLLHATNSILEAKPPPPHHHHHHHYHFWKVVYAPAMLHSQNKFGPVGMPGGK